MMTPEISSDRTENKFVIPVSSGRPFLDQLPDIIAQTRLEPEHYPNNVNRTIYYFPEHVNGFRPKFSIRYRDYITADLSDPNISKMQGSYEIKFGAQGGNEREKIKFRAPFTERFTVSTFRKHILESGADPLMIQEAIEEIDRQHVPEDDHFIPLVATTYARSRYRYQNNVFNVDSDIHFFAVEPNDDHSISFVQIGSYGGLICEWKDGGKPQDQWPIYRALVDYDASETYGKKAEALNYYSKYLLSKYQTSSLSKELGAEEIEVKHTLNDPSVITDILNTLYHQFPQYPIENGFYISDQCPVFTSYTSMNTYFVDPENPAQESKLINMWGVYRFSHKGPTTGPSENTSDGLHRAEDKGIINEFNRDATRILHGSQKKAGKVMRIRNCFWVHSPTERVYKVSVDWDIVQPSVLNKEFGQLEIEYTGRAPSYEAEARDVAWKHITQELGELDAMVQQTLKNQSIMYTPGGRKVDILKQLEEKQQLPR